MDEFLILVTAAFILVACAMGAMAIGVMFRRPCLRGSCGGTAATGPDGEPMSCGNCPNRN
jgi:hypothetical protein